MLHLPMNETHNQHYAWLYAMMHSGFSFIITVHASTMIYNLFAQDNLLFQYHKPKPGSVDAITKQQLKPQLKRPSIFKPQQVVKRIKVTEKMQPVRARTVA